jgi:hypothetical protein
VPRARRCLGAVLGRPAVPGIPVRARFEDQDIATTVDSEIARYYLENYLQGQRTRPELDASIDEAERCTTGPLPGSEALREMAGRFSVDFAALLLLRCIRHDPVNRRLYERFRSESANGLCDAAQTAAKDYRDYALLFVPGMLYQADPDSGADFHRPRELLAQLGFDQHLVEIDQVGPVEHNARIVAQHVIEHGRTGKKVILISASSAGPAIALTLAEHLGDTDARVVRAWVNIGGILRGSWRADAVFRWPTRWWLRALFAWKGWKRFDAGRSYCTAVSAERFARLRLPPHLLIVNYVGVPLSGDVSRRARRGYRRMRALGPNDGLTPILDAIAPGSLTIADLGLDHYYLHPQIDVKTMSLARTVLGWLESD